MLPGAPPRVDDLTDCGVPGPDRAHCIDQCQLGLTRVALDLP